MIQFIDVSYTVFNKSELLTFQGSAATYLSVVGNIGTT